MPGSLLSRAAVLPQVPLWSRVFRAGCGGKGETAAVCELVGITGPSATPLPSPFICTVKNSPGYLHFLFNSLCIFTFFFPRLYQGELVNYSMENSLGARTKFSAGSGACLLGFFSRRIQFLELPVRRQRVNSPLGFTAWERCGPGLKYGWV